MFGRKYLSQAGRNMIEMLAVLGVIAVLTIGGLFGYRYGMRVHQSNQIFDDVNRFSFSIEERKDHLGPGDIDEKDFVPNTSFTIAAVNEPEEERYHIDVYHVPSPLCQLILEKGKENYVFIVNETFYEGNSEICQTETEEGNVMRFYFGNTDNMCNLCADPDASSCCDGCVCAEDTTCMTAEKNPGTYGKKCCKSGEVNCGGHCVAANCPSGQKISFDTCQCDCEDPMKEQVIQDDGSVKCECKTEDGGTKRLTEKDGKCICPDGLVYSGAPGKGMCCSPSSIYVPDHGCKEFSCPDGDGGWCYIDTALCGINCTGTSSSQTISCPYFQCRSEQCSNPDNFGRVPYGKSSAGGFSWGCLINENCIEFGTGGAYMYCFNNAPNLPNECCTSDSSGNCIEGSCKSNICEQFEGKDPYVEYVSSGYVNYRLGGCRFRNGVECWPKANGKWTCIPQPNSNPCITDCDMNEKNCWEACSDVCGGDGRVKDGDHCCYYHSVTGKIICRKEAGFYFWDGGDYNLCGHICTVEKTGKNVDGYPEITEITCQAGHCESPKCKSGWEYKKTFTAEGWWGCVKGEIECFQTGTGYGYMCFEKGLYSSQNCGGNCTTDEKGNLSCATWWRKACAPTATDKRPYCVYGQRMIQDGEEETDTVYRCNCKGDIVNKKEYDGGVIVEREGEKYCCPEGQIFLGTKCVFEI